MGKVLHLRRRSIEDLIDRALAIDGRLIPRTEEGVASMESILGAAPAEADAAMAGESFVGAQRKLRAIMDSRACGSNRITEEALRLLQEIGSDSLRLAAASAGAFLALGTRSQTVIRAIESRLREPMTDGEKAALLEGMGHTCRVMADCEARADLPIADAVAHLRHPDTCFYSLVEGDGRRIVVALGAAGDKRFNATWLAFPGKTDVFLIRCEGA